MAIYISTLVINELNVSQCDVKAVWEQVGFMSNIRNRKLEPTWSVSLRNLLH